MRIGLLLPAAGHGLRLAALTPKQMLKVGGRSLFSHTINAFVSQQEHLVVIVLLVPEECVVAATFEVSSSVIPELRDKVSVIVGCETRHRTIARGLVELDRHRIDVTVIHDAVRPLVPASLLQQVLETAEKFGASGPVTKLTSTVVSTDENGFLDKVLNRSQYLDSQMPQAFRHHVIKEAYDNCTKDDLDNGTECLALVQKYSSMPIPIRLIESDPNFLWKVTYRKDLLLSLMTLDSCSAGKQNICLLTDESKRRDKRRVVEEVTQNLNTFFNTKTKTNAVGLNGLTVNESSAKCVILRFCTCFEEFTCQVRELESFSESCPSLLLIIVLQSDAADEERGRMTPFFSQLEGLIGRRSGHCALLYFLHHSQTDSQRKEKRIRFHSLTHFLLLKDNIFTGQILIV